jgi:hypothetical protein
MTDWNCSFFGDGFIRFSAVTSQHDYGNYPHTVNPIRRSETKPDTA